MFKGSDDEQYLPAVKPEMPINSKVYRLAAVAAFGFLMLIINSAVVHTVTDNHCAKGDKQACKVAAQWGYVYHPLPPIGSAGYDKAYCEGNLGCHWIPYQGGGGFCMCG